MSWYAVYTKPQHERKVNVHLSQEGITTFLPEMERWSRRKDRKKKVLYPIFPGYIFINTDLGKDSWLKIIKTKGVVKILDNNGIPTSIPEHQIEAIQRLVENRKAISPYPYLKKGQTVQVISGPLKGLEGTPSPLSYPEYRQYAAACRYERDFYLAGPRFLGRLRHEIVLRAKKRLSLPL